MATKLLLALQLILVGMLIYFSCVVLPPMRCENFALKIQNQILINTIHKMQHRRGV